LRWNPHVPVLTKAPAQRVRIGLAVDAGPSLGYGHAVRCLRIARAFGEEAAVYPISQTCRRFFEANGMESSIQDFRSEVLPPVMVTDLRESHSITRSIHEQDIEHISIHDMGLGQCHSHIAIDGSIAFAVPYTPDPQQSRFFGPRYMVTRPSVSRAPAEGIEDTVLVTLGGGASAEFACRLADQLRPLGMRVVTTPGFGSNPNRPMTPDSEIVRTMARCRFAISASGTTLYDLLASGVPAIAVAVDRLQLQTADAFQSQGAVLSAGLLDRLSAAELLDRCRELLGNPELVSRMVASGQKLVDGQGLRRVVEIIGNSGRDIWKTPQTQTSTVC